MSENRKKLDDTMLENVTGGEMLAASMFDEEESVMCSGVACRGCRKLIYPENKRKYICPHCGYSFEWKG